MFVRPSRFRHVFGCPSKKETCYEGLKATKSAHDTNFCAVNPLFLAVVVESSGGGSFVVLPIEKTGRVDVNLPKVCGHRAQITDLKWCPHNDHCIASCSDDTTIKVWSIPDGGLFQNITEPVVDLVEGHYKRVSYIEWHPCARDVLLSAGADFKCIVWDVRDGVILSDISTHPDVVFSISWNHDGSLFATTCKDKLLRIIDPRSGETVAQGMGHQGNKASKVVFLNGTLIFTTGFSRTSERQHALWDSNNLSRPLKIEELDSSCGSIFPFFDPDLDIVYLAGKGDGNIKYVEIIDQPPYIYFLNQFQSSIPQRGLGMMPKRGLDMKRCEIARFYKLHSSKDICEPISMIVPRKSDSFQPDIYPPTQSTQPALTADEWFSGVNKPPVLLPLQNEVVSSRSSRAKTMSYFELPTANENLYTSPQHTKPKETNISRSKSLQHGLANVGLSSFSSPATGTQPEQYSSVTNLSNTESMRKMRHIRRRRRSRHEHEEYRSSPSSYDDDENDTRYFETSARDAIKRPRAVSSIRNLRLSPDFVTPTVNTVETSKSYSSNRNYIEEPQNRISPLNQKQDIKISENGSDNSLPENNSVIKTNYQVEKVLDEKTYNHPEAVNFTSPVTNNTNVPVLVQNVVLLGSAQSGLNPVDNDDSEKHDGRTMLDCISVDAPDDALILPSTLRQSMNSRHRKVASSRVMYGQREARTLNPELEGLIRVGSVREKSRSYNGTKGPFVPKNYSEFDNVHSSYEKENAIERSIVDNKSSVNNNNIVTRTMSNNEYNQRLFRQTDNGTPSFVSKTPVDRTTSLQSNGSSTKILPHVQPTSVTRRLPGKSLNDLKQSSVTQESFKPSPQVESRRTEEDSAKDTHERKPNQLERKNGMSEIAVRSQPTSSEYKRSTQKHSNTSLSHSELLQEYSKQQQEIKSLKALLDQRDQKIKKLEEELQRNKIRK